MPEIKDGTETKFSFNSQPFFPKALKISVKAGLLVFPILVSFPSQEFRTVD
jgi:hypothetical protein